jgi:hypothetical protein
VKIRIEYLNLLVLLTFLAGQVQFAYTTYYCTMKQMAVKTPAMSTTSMDSSTGDVCDQCQEVIPPLHGEQIADGSCIKVVTAEKSVVSSFNDSVKLLSHVAITFSSVPTSSYQPSAVSYQLFRPTDSPPRDLPTFNSNLRI